MILNGLLVKCPPKKRSFDVFKMTYYIVFTRRMCEKLKLWIFWKSSRVAEKLRSFKMFHPHVFARTCLYCFAFVAMGWYL